MTTKRDRLARRSTATVSAHPALVVALGALCALASGNEAWAARDFCADTARTLFAACKEEGADDALLRKAICINVASPAARNICLEESRSERDEHKQVCMEQRAWRLDACTELGKGRYDPDFSPALFDDPKNPTQPNPYFPLAVGNKWEFHGTGNEVNVIEVLNETKRIAGVDCIVVRDTVTRDGDLHEDTDDWYCHAKTGDVWYFGEEVKNYETFDGDNPKRPELVSIDGSFKAGRNGDKPGIIFLAAPAQGAVYTEEFSLGNAEDVTEILSVAYAYGSDPALDAGVPQALAQHLCGAGDCIVTKNFSLLEPDIFARKYYAKGIGVFLEIESEGDVVQLVDCNVDPKCATLP